MRVVPNPWGNSKFDYLKAVVIGLFLLGGLIVSLQRGSWIIALIWTVLILAAAVTWARDLTAAMKKV
jgi:hypothetical protein